jgi:FkbM family methyltransferase
VHVGLADVEHLGDLASAQVRSEPQPDRPPLPLAEPVDRLLQPRVDPERGAVVRGRPLVRRLVKGPFVATSQAPVVVHEDVLRNREHPCRLAAPSLVELLRVADHPLERLRGQILGVRRAPDAVDEEGVHPVEVARVEGVDVEHGAGCGDGRHLTAVVSAALSTRAARPSGDLSRRALSVRLFCLCFPAAPVTAVPVFGAGPPTGRSDPPGIASSVSPPKEPRSMSATLHSRLRLARVRAGKAAMLARIPSHWSAVRAGVVPTVEHGKVPLGGPYGTVLDVGASRGQFALHARRRFPQARIVCFEPLPTSQTSIRAVLGDQVEIVAAAVGAEPGAASMHVSASDDSSSLLPIGARQRAEFPGTEEASRLDVPVVTLADTLAAPTAEPILLKIDVQGFELDVLRGAGDAIQRIQTVFVECSFVELYEGQALADEVVTYLSGHGFRLAGVHGLATGRGGEALQADLLFRHDRHERSAVVPSAPHNTNR